MAPRVVRPLSEAGVSLVDVMVTILFLGIIMAGAIPGLVSAASSMRLGQGAREVERELQTARLKAVATNRPMRVRFNCPAAGQYRMVELLGTPTAPASGDSATDRCSTTAYPYPPADRNSLTLPNQDGPVRYLPQGVTFGSAATLEFWSDGSAHKQSATENPWLVIPTTGTAITVTKDTTVKTITVNGLGKIQLQQ